MGNDPSGKAIQAARRTKARCVWTDKEFDGDATWSLVLSAAYAIDFAALQQENKRLEDENGKLKAILTTPEVYVGVVTEACEKHWSDLIVYEKQQNKALRAELQQARVLIQEREQSLLHLEKRVLPLLDGETDKVKAIQVLCKAGRDDFIEREKAETELQQAREENELLKKEPCQCVCHQAPDHGKLQDALEALKWHQHQLAQSQERIHCLESEKTANALTNAELRQQLAQIQAENDGLMRELKTSSLIGDALQARLDEKDATIKELLDWRELHKARLDEAVGLLKEARDFCDSDRLCAEIAAFQERLGTS